MVIESRQISGLYNRYANNLNTKTFSGLFTLKKRDDMLFFQSNYSIFIEPKNS